MFEQLPLLACAYHFGQLDPGSVHTTCTLRGSLTILILVPAVAFVGLRCSVDKLNVPNNEKG